MLGVLWESYRPTTPRHFHLSGGEFFIYCIMTKYIIDDMKVIVNRIIPFPGFVAMMLYGTIFMRKDYEWWITSSSKMYQEKLHRMVTHESIHKAQMLDFCKWIPLGGTIFYLLYGIEWLLKILPCLFTGRSAYENLSSEVEAYQNENDRNYVNVRSRFKWLHNFFKLQ